MAANVGGVNSAWATDYLVENLTFENSETFANGWVKSNDPNLKQVTSGTNKFLLIASTGNVATADAARYTFSSFIQNASEWKLEFDWNGYGSSNNRSNYVDVCNTAGTTIFRIYWKNASDDDGNFGLQKLVGSSLTTFSTAVPYVHYSKSDRESDTRAVPAYHFLLTADAVNGVQLTVTKLSDESTVVSTTKIYDFFNLGSMYAYAYEWYSAISLDNIQAYVVADADPVTAPTLRYTKHGNAPVVTPGETATGSTSKTYYCTAESATPATEGTLWTNNSSTLPSAGTYYFYSVSDDATAGVSPATVYSYINGIYENYDFEYWMNDDGTVDFTSAATAFKGHSLNDRIAFGGNWQTVVNGIQGTSQGNEMHFKNMTTSDKVILTFTGGYVRSYNSGSNFGYGKTMTDLTSGTVYSTAAGTNKLWDRNSTSGKYAIFTKVQVVTPNYTFYTAPVIDMVAGKGSTSLTITPAKVRDTDGDIVVTNYFTTDGSDPTDSENANRVTSLTSVTTSATVKVASYYGGVYSEITSLYVPVDETLNTPTIQLSEMVANGDFYNPKYTIAWSNTGMAGAPIATLSATFNGTPIDITSGYYTATENGKLIVTASADNYTSAKASMTVYADYTLYSTPKFDEIPLADLSTTLGGTWTDDGTDRWSNWSTTGGKNADLSSTGDGKYAKYKLTSSGEVTVGEWFKFTRNRGSSNLHCLAGYGLGEYQYSPTMTINSPTEGAIVEYQSGYTSPTVYYATVTAENESTGKWLISFDKCVVLRYCKYYESDTRRDIHTAIANCKAYETSAAFATAINSENFASVAEVYAFHSAWQIAKANTNGSTDYSKAIMNRTFELHNTNGWTITGDAATAAEDNDKYGVVEYGEDWSQYYTGWNGRNVSQNIAGLPAGTYRLTAKVYSWGGGAPVRLFANGQLSTAENGDDHDPVLSFTVTGNEASIKIGIGGVGNNNDTDNTWGTWGYRVKNFTLTKLTAGVTVGKNGYTTFASPYALDLTDENRPEGLKAYKATLSGSNLSFQQLHQTVPAGTGLLLLGETNDSTYNIPIVESGDDVETALTGVLTPTAKQSDEDGDYYFVMRKAKTAEEALTFAPITTGHAVTIPEGKVYVTVPSSAFVGGGARAIAVSFDDDETTGIDNLTPALSKGERVIYNLNGQRIDKPAKGLYIVNGKKVFVK